MIYIEGGSKAQQALSKELYYFCSQELSIKKKVEIDLRIEDVKHAEAWTDHEGEDKFYIDIEKDLRQINLLLLFVMK